MADHVTVRTTAALLASAACLAVSWAGGSAGVDGSPGTAEPRRAGFSIGLVADAQYCDCDPKRSRYYRASLAKLATATDEFDRAGVAFTVQVGDLIDRYSESFEAIVPVYNRLDSPGHHVLGNHDFPLSSAAVVRRLGMPNEHYQLSRGAWRFVVLDTNDISLYANPVGSRDHERAQRILAELEAAGAPNAKGFNGAAGRGQVRWLRTVLADARAQGQRVVVFGHMPVHGSSPHNAWDDTAIRQAMAKAGNVVAYVHGHDHAGGYAVGKGIHHLGLHGMVEQSRTSNAYAVLHLRPDRLRVNGFGREPDRTLPIDP